MKLNWKRVLLIVIIAALLYGFITNWSDIKKGFIDGWNDSQSSQSN